MSETEYMGWRIEPRSYLLDGNQWRPKAVVSRSVGGQFTSLETPPAPVSVMFGTRLEADAHAVDMAKKWIDDQLAVA
jgi:hypothetical protein